MLNHLEWRSLEQRRKDARLTILFKIVIEKVAVRKVDRLIYLNDCQEICMTEASKFQQHQMITENFLSFHEPSKIGTVSLLWYVVSAPSVEDFKDSVTKLN